MSTFLRKIHPFSRRVNPFAVLVLLATGIASGLPSSIAAETVEIGITGTLGARQSNRFNRGMERFRSTLSPNVFNNVDVDPFNAMHSGHGWVRADILAPRHYLGIAWGGYVIPQMRLNEYRSDGVYTRTRWAFTLPYFLVTYHYIAPFQILGMSRNLWTWEAGVALGFVQQSSWRIRGQTVTESLQFSNYQVKQDGRTGNMGRAEVGVSRLIVGGLFLRVATGVSYAVVHTWDTEINDSAGAVYYNRDGGLVPLSSFNLITAQSIATANDSPELLSSQLRERADMASTTVELQLSVGYRF